MGHNNYHDTAARWVARCLGENRPALRNIRLLDRGDSILSYGSHFEVARVLRTRRGRPRAWLLNGESASQTTTRHQGTVRSAIASTGLPTVTIPLSALDAAGIERASVEIIDVQPDWTVTRTHTRETAPGKWVSMTVPAEPPGWVNSRTSEWVEGYWSEKPSNGNPTPRPEWDHGDAEEWDAYIERLHTWEVHDRLRYGEWEPLPARYKPNGHQVMTSGPRGATTWEMIDAPTAPLGYVFQRQTHRHMLGASLIRATVAVPVTRPCKACPEAGSASTCSSCWGRGRVRSIARRRAYFLSGFDENESRPSYFFCELPRWARPASVEDAYIALRPDAVNLATAVGREVKRQGDIFAIPLPGFTPRRGVARQRMPKGRTASEVSTGNVEGVPYLLGTNHAATETVTIDGMTYARGTLRHAPVSREPDHRRVSLGGDWHLIVKNTVPAAA